VTAVAGPAAASPSPWRRALAVVASFLRRDWATVRSYRLPFVLDVFTTFFALFLFFFLARLVDGADLSRFEGLERGYLPFAVIGMAVFRMVQSALTSFNSKLRTEQTTGTLEALLATPTSPRLVILANATYDVLRAALSGVLMVVLALTLGVRLTTDPAALAVTGLALLALIGLFGALGVAVAAFGIVFKQAGGLIGMITAGLALLGGVYFPTEVFPTWLAWIADALPFTWGVDVLRTALITGELDTTRLLALAASALVTLPLSLWLFKLAVDKARRDGSLGQY